MKEGKCVFSISLIKQGKEQLRTGIWHTAPHKWVPITVLFLAAAPTLLFWFGSSGGSGGVSISSFSGVARGSINIVIWSCFFICVVVC